MERCYWRLTSFPRSASELLDIPLTLSRLVKYCKIKREEDEHLGWLGRITHTEQGRALCVLERAPPTEAAQLAGLNHSYLPLLVSLGNHKSQLQTSETSGQSPQQRTGYIKQKGKKEKKESRERNGKEDEKHEYDN